MVNNILWHGMAMTWNWATKIQQWKTNSANYVRNNTTMKKTGSVQWFDPTKGYGFIAPDNGSKDVCSQ